MKKLALISISLFFFALSFSQNLVPNPGFEACYKKPVRWSGHAGHFNNISQKWMSPNQGSPDVIWEESMHSLFPKRKGISFEGHEARSGDKMIGIKTYGCNSGIMQCREYVEVKLEERLIPCATYYLEFWLNPVANSVRVNNFGAAVFDKPYIEPYAELLEDVELVINEEHIVDGQPNEWQKVSGSFVAQSPALFLVIGNFFRDDETLAKKTPTSIPYSFYLLDDVLLRREPGTYDMSCLLQQPSGTVFSLEEVYFDHNQHSIQASSFPVLEELANILLENPGLSIELHGHTDDTGSATFNQELSEHRAEAVSAFLMDKGVVSTRLSTKGFGATQAVAENTDEAGRQLNRRVEVKIIQQD